MLEPDKVWAVVPVKSLGSAKSRLALAMSQRERSSLCLALLEHVIDQLAASHRVGHWAVVSRDPLALTAAGQRGGIGLAETGVGLNGALTQGVIAAVGRGAEAVLMLPADLPAVSSRELDELVNLADQSPCVVISRAMRDGGTNALMVTPPTVVIPTFGLDSFEAHCRQARKQGIPVRRFDAPGLAFDLDTPEDLQRIDLSDWPGTRRSIVTRRP